MLDQVWTTELAVEMYVQRGEMENMQSCSPQCPGMRTAGS